MSNPALHCRVEKSFDGEWCIGSDYWQVPCVDEKAARRLREIIQGAYDAGERDLRGKFNNLLGSDEFGGRL